jgi:3-deoxy-D-manno-octulosonic acid (KDO) 8-phosphate synthase
MSIHYAGASIGADTRAVPVSGQESTMGTRSWTALALVALAVVVIFFALRETHSDPQSAPGRAASQETIKPIPSNPDLVTPRHPANPAPTQP